MKNINNIVNKVRNVNEKNINIKERLMRKKPENERKFIQIMTKKVESREITKEKIEENPVTILKKPPLQQVVQSSIITKQNMSDFFNGLKNCFNADADTDTDTYNNRNETNNTFIILSEKERMDDTEWQVFSSNFSVEELEHIKNVFVRMYDDIDKTNNSLTDCEVNMKLVNVYQPVFAFHKNANGLGDFIRGCYFLMQFCEEEQIEFDIDMSFHMISKYLQKYVFNETVNNNKLVKTKIYNSIVKFEENNFLENISPENIILSRQKNKEEVNNKFITYLNSQPFFCNYLDMDMNMNMNNIHMNKPIDTKYIYTGTFPFYNIKKEQRERMKKELEPSNEIKLEVKSIMNSLNLTDGKFVVIHIRCGDTYLLNKSRLFSKDFLEKVVKEIKEWVLYLLSQGFSIQNTSSKEKMNDNKEEIGLFVTADNNYIKRWIIKLFPYMKTLFLDITHVGEGEQLEEEKVKNNMIELSIMSKSRVIFGLSTYKHGTGFSKWCAETYSIPYVCKYISYGL